MELYGIRAERVIQSIQNLDNSALPGHVPSAHAADTNNQFSISSLEDRHEPR